MISAALRRIEALDRTLDQGLANLIEIQERLAEHGELGGQQERDVPRHRTSSRTACHLDVPEVDV